MNPNRILVAHDFSPYGDRAFATGIALARRFGAQLHVVHAYHLPVLVGMPDEIAIPTEFWTGVRDAAARRVEAAVALARAAGIVVEPHLVEGPPAEAIREVAEQVSADLIVIGTRGHTGLKHVLLGSVAERTLRHAPCAVLTVKDDVIGE
jgi:nucleotide-binding universal stress UspA family protein